MTDVAIATKNARAQSGSTTTNYEHPARGVAHAFTHSGGLFNPSLKEDLKPTSALHFNPHYFAANNTATAIDEESPDDLEVERGFDGDDSPDSIGYDTVDDTSSTISLKDVTTTFTHNEDEVVSERKMADDISAYNQAKSQDASLAGIVQKASSNTTDKDVASSTTPELAPQNAVYRELDEDDNPQNVHIASPSELANAQVSALAQSFAQNNTSRPQPKVQPQAHIKFSEALLGGKHQKNDEVAKVKAQMKHIGKGLEADYVVDNRISEEALLFPERFVNRLSPADDPNQLALKAKLLATLGWRMAQSGAETRLIVQSVKKMAHDLGCTAIELGFSREGIICKIRHGHAISVEYKEIKHFAINMDSLDRIHKICLSVSKGELRDPKKIFLAIRAVRPRHYPQRQLIFIEAIAGACFAYLNGGNFAVCMSALVGGIFLMYTRFLIIRRGFFEAFAFMVSAFVGSFVASMVANYGFHTNYPDTILSATATTLLLVPGFPLINGFLDIFKGYVPVGITRLIIAVVLVISAAIGLLVTFYLSSVIFTLIP